MKYWLMSFKPTYGFEILSSLKNCEVRTCFSVINSNDVVYVYVSKPLKSLIGYFVVDNSICINSFEKLLEVVDKYECIFTPDNWNYVVSNYKYSSRILLIKVKNTKFFEKKVDLNKLREIVDGFKPPRSYFELSSRYKGILEYLLGII